MNYRKEIRKVTIPLAIMGLLRVNASMVNIYFMGKYLSSVGVAAITLAHYTLWFSAGIWELLEVGYSCLIGNIIQDKDNYEYQKQKKNYLIASLVIGFITGITIFILSENMSQLFYKGLGSDIVLHGKHYLQVMCADIVIKFIIVAMFSILSFEGKAKVIPKIIVLNCIADIVFTSLLSPRYQVIGAAGGTVIADMISLLAATFIMYKSSNDEFHVEKLPRHSFKYEDLFYVFKKGFPVFIRELFAVVCCIVLIKYRNLFGVEIVATWFLVGQISCICYDTAEGYAKGVTVLTASHSRDRSYLKRLKKVIYFDSLLVGVVTATVMIVFAKPLYDVFIGDCNFNKITMLIFTVVAVEQIFTSIALFLTGYTDGLGFSRFSSNITVFSYILELIIIIISIEFFRHKLPLDGFSAFLFSRISTSFIWGMCQIVGSIKAFKMCGCK